MNKLNAESSNIIYEYCTLCDCLYPLKNRSNHLANKKHCVSLKKQNITNELVTVEHYSLKFNGVVETNGVVKTNGVVEINQ